MKIAIFGDSFAVNENDFVTPSDDVRKYIKS